MHKRKKLFLAFTILFFISVPVVIIYTQGYRLDLENRKLVETGGIDLEITPVNSEVYINDKYEKETSFLFRNAIFRNIIPGEYTIRIEKEDYHSWQKATTVDSGQVAKFPGIMLFPLELQTAKLTDEVSSLNMAPNDRFAVINRPAPETTEGTATQQLVFTDLSERILTPLLTLQSQEQVRQIGWSSDSSVFHILIDSSTGPLLYIGTTSGNEVEITSHNAFLSRSYPAAYDEDNIVVSANSPSLIYVFKREANNTFSIDRVNLENRTIRPDIAEDVLGFNVLGNDVFFLDSEGTIGSINLDDLASKTLSPTAIAKPSISDSKIIARGDKQALVVINNGSVFLWHEGDSLKKIGENMDDAKFSPDRKKLLMWNKDNVTIYWLEEVFGPPQKMPGDTEIIEFENINHALWVDGESTHIAAQTQDKVIFTELDSRDRRNTVEYEIKTEPGSITLDLSKQVIYTLLENGELTILDYK